MNQPRRRRRAKDWYTVSVDTLRALGLIALLLAVAGTGFLLYRHWQERALEREARGVLEEAAALLQRVEGGGGRAALSADSQDAWTSLERGRVALDVGEFAEALEHGRRARALLQSMLDALRDRPATGEAQFIAVQGGVEYRRGERGEWEEARGRLVLQSGDYVKTSANGSAEIVFLDGTLYTVRPNTLFLVTRTRAGAGQPGSQTIAMQYGWVNLNTAQRGSRVTTPRAEARVAEQSEAVVAYDERAGEGRFAAYRGSVEVASSTGTERRLGALQQVTQTGDLLSEARPLPPAPAAREPADRAEFALGAARTLTLAWQDLPGTPRYALQVSRSRLFVDNLVDVEGRVKSSATLGVRGAGSFLWRVAAISPQGLQGPWSAPRSFRVATSSESGGSEADRVPPPLDIEEVQVYGSLVIVGGRTEPGAVVAVNGEQVATAADGSFTKTVQLANEGWTFVEIKARDVAGNETVRRRRVFLETL
ncbi:MAG: FecR domain-containing protein [Thermoanaerobaculia bacterium]|nr:FecR domain-containing protein [Thermoanaerobaculia bacterium]MCZ7652400.1 FecR domain-containing protein [Thermoanaerobaculia bacterium]